ncbi:uncharacterized protein BO97DRAFT_408523 [Aspergillus homomorphus CBS 101889]|uniref:Uncharacterized protein n=1 Tax=Aspergillus homomorphus (strain CBS 101889) TaxID=1450537 RepID=A0A395HK46_ASPHC|nr:hypothetical protein BO97DRAFT_408523 [Aspergillus homomorphus CBS 101889]RAL08187.1 hypothetical protein BO97DRAFT_408523 [Aspergillus homomorphus CBS 101889]
MHCDRHTGYQLNQLYRSPSELDLSSWTIDVSHPLQHSVQSGRLVNCQAPAAREAHRPIDDPIMA